MTSNEARQKIDACERQIVGAYSGLKDSARQVGSSAASSASSATSMKTLLPLILCLIGLFDFLDPFLGIGIFFIPAGIFISVKLHGSAKSVKNNIENMQKKLNSTIDNNANI